MVLLWTLSGPLVFHMILWLSFHIQLVPFLVHYISASYLNPYGPLVVFWRSFGGPLVVLWWFFRDPWLDQPWSSGTSVVIDPVVPVVVFWTSGGHLVDF